MVLISLVSVLNLLYFYISTFRSICAVHSMAVFCSSLTSCFPGMLLTYFLNGFEIVPVAPIITGITFVFTFLYLGQCAALRNRTECERYWEARIKMMEKWLCFFLLLLFLWLLLTFRTFIFTLNIFSIFNVILTFYFYWSHRSMMNNQCACH